MSVILEDPPLPQAILAVWPFAARTFLSMSDCLFYENDFPAQTTREAVELARAWAKQKPGNVAIAYNRATGQPLTHASFSMFQKRRKRQVQKYSSALARKRRRNNAARLTTRVRR